MTPTCAVRETERGFTLIEIMIATAVLVIALLSMAYGVGVGMVVALTSDQEAIARQKAREAMEDVLTARDTGNISWTQICNLPTAGCIFISGSEPLYTAGPDEIVNTADDGEAVNGSFPRGCSAAPCVETVDTPGPDGILGTADDIFVPLSGFTRQIIVTPLSSQPPLAQIQVIITFTTRQGITRSVTVNAVISPYV